MHAAAVNAVMAGCKPEYFPVAVAAFEAMNEPGFNFHGSTASTGGSAPLLIISGPIIDDIGMNADVNLFGSLVCQTNPLKVIQENIVSALPNGPATIPGPFWFKNKSTRPVSAALLFSQVVVSAMSRTMEAINRSRS